MSNDDDKNTASDTTLWKMVTKGIKPFHPNRDIEEPKRLSAVKKKDVIPQSFFKSEPKVETPISNKTIARDVDKRTSEKLRKGKIRIEGRLDLHGMNQDQAKTALYSFLHNAYKAEKRCVLVITGKGSAKPSDQGFGFWDQPKTGILKQRLPDWLYASDMNDIVLRHVTAQPKDGGGGAFYVYLRRNRN